MNLNSFKIFALIIILVLANAASAQTAPPLQLGGNNAAPAVTVFAQSAPKQSVSPPAKISANAEPLDPEVAFKLSAALNEQTLKVSFDIAPGYYLYAEKIKLSAASPAHLDQIQRPKGELHFDATFNKTLETYRNRLNLTARVKGLMTAQPLELTVQSQGCADIGICYPPQTQVLRIEAHSKQALTTINALTASPDAALTTPALASASNVTSTEPTAIASVLRGDNWALLAVSFIGLGLLLAFTPCVLPMVPIVSSIVVGKLDARSPSRWRGLALSAAYVLGMAAVYTALGIAAGLAGQGLAAALQNIGVIAVFALLMVVLAGAQFGWYELQLPQAWMGKLNDASPQGGAFAGAAALGALSAVMVGPCLTAPLAATLAFIAQTGQAFKGGVALFSLALGMGTPLLLIGAGGGALLPTAGAWMERVKHGFGLGLLAVALWMVQPFAPSFAVALAWAGLLIGAGVSLGALESAQYGWARVAKAAGVAVLVWGGAVLWGAAGGQFDALQPLNTGASNTNNFKNTSALAFEAITSPQALAVKLAQAKAQGKPVLLDFYADWCVSCVEMARFTFSDPAVMQVLSGFMLLKADVTQNTATDAALMRQFGIFGPPSHIFYDTQGHEISAARISGFLPAAEFLTHISTQINKKNTAHMN